MSEPVQSGRSEISRPHALTEELRRLRRAAVVVAVAGALLCALGAFLSPAQFLRSYLIAFVFWLQIALGCLAFGLLGHVAGGGWGAVIRRPVEAAARTVGPMALLFVPIAIGLPYLYEWARPEAVAHDPIIAHKAPYLNVPFFVVRAAIYFAAWAGFAYGVSRMSLAQDRGVTEQSRHRLRRVSAVGLMVYCLTMTLASIDWLMSLSPHWYSTIYGVYVIGGQGVAALAFTVLVMLGLARHAPVSAVMRVQHFHDLGKMLLAFVMLWAYFAISQFLVIWSGNLPEDAPFFISRARGVWRFVSLALVLLHFALPFLLLLSRELKRNTRKLAMVAGLLLVMRWVDVYWLVTPTLSPDRLVFHWLDVAAFAAIGGVWLLLFARELTKRPLLPLADPLLQETTAHRQTAGHQETTDHV